ncbi:inosine-uridine preferring nucleoside hydrolase family protein, partial [Vibrio harveyi]
IRKR